MDFPVLNGPRISLRRVEAESPVDVESMYRCYQCPEAHRYMQGRAFRREEWPEIIRDWEKEGFPSARTSIAPASGPPAALSGEA